MTCVKRLKKCCGIVDKKVGKREDKKVRMKWRSNREAMLSNRISELLKVTTDKEYRNKLLIEYGIA